MGKTILVVDDDRMNLRMAEMVLVKKGYIVQKASSGAECLDMLKTERPDLVLLDVEMPKQSGIEVLAAIRGDASLAGLPVLFLSASEDIEQKVADGTYAATGVVKKPFLPPQLLLQVEKFI